jgi:type II secretory pathway pseudopilin PulG
MAIVLPNFLGARERARDAKLKAEMNQLKSALRMYYNDYQRYPAWVGAPLGPQGQWSFLGCGPSGTTVCKNDITTTPPGYECPNFWFAAGGTDGCGTIYMKKPPTTTRSTPNYYQSDPDNFTICVPLENASDPDAASSRAQCPNNGSTLTNYCVCSD